MPLWYKLFGKTGLYCFIAFTTVVANIEVMILVEAFSLEQTLGNVLFATTFLATDMLSEFENRESADKAVNIGIAASIMFIMISQLWLLYTPSQNDWASESFHVIFSSTPRIMFASVVVYAVAQKLDVWLYHKWWNFTAKKMGDSRKMLWVRNNFSTLVSQLVNTILYNLFAFGGVYSGETLLSIIAAGYVVFIVTSICDTPVMYFARYLREKGKL